ncbi:hypothetical protein RJ640_018238 [Escallonia rubra]|uniref:holo-[acyl-carrier-protein] synthase n=1 Tax=Escallonia rubra TaxID=112253 RepID=A0AA88U2Q1_9ASTE|nr:hypothetical protein RJ640_018238 [Escallonia rubra]
MELEKGVKRWVVDISAWNPSRDDFSLAMSFLPLHDHPSITRFVKLEDRKRALVSRLLQYALVHEVLGIPFDEIVIKRTVEGKPYLEYEKAKAGFPNFNFNASHHGNYVAIASEPICLVGLDIASPSIPHKETVPEFIQNFSSYFSRVEWDKICNSGPCDETLKEFYRFNVYTTHNGFTRNKMILLNWHYHVAVARGHPRAATENFKKTLNQTAFDKEEYQLALHLPNPSFVLKTVEEVIPFSLRSGGFPI